MAPQQTRLWTTAFVSPGFERESVPRDRFRVALENARETAGHIAAEIAADLPGFTQHDLSHLDALWELADEISGPGVTLNPAEAFVFGVAVLVHDLAMSESAHVLTGSELRSHSLWPDVLGKHLRSSLNRPPTPSELASPPLTEARAAEEELIRQLHAERAERLPLAEWQRLDGSRGYLISDAEIRSAYGLLIGRIAASHHWDRLELVNEFGTPAGSPAFAPTAWRVDSLVLAALLRTADAAHLDSSRVPDVLAAARRISGVSLDHWKFQSKLQRPYVQGDRLTFTAPAGFDSQEIGAWWLAYDVLRMVDRELHGVDGILGDTSRARFCVSGVAHIDSPQSLRAVIPCLGWEPVQAQVQVSDVAGLVRRLGGSELYGDQAMAAVRELVVNASDAVQGTVALAEFMGRAEPEARVILRLSRQGDDFWLSVEDTGLGMSPGVLSGPLLDFGRSSWLAHEVIADNPGLVASTFTPTGRFGIGFFAVFMLGSDVMVTSRPQTGGPHDTHVLEFSDGLSQRPVLRRAGVDERRHAPGTTVSVKLDQRLVTSDGLLLTYDRPVRGHWEGRSESRSLADLVRYLCPASKVDIYAQEVGATDAAQVISGDDWITIDGVALMERVFGTSVADLETSDRRDVEEIGSNLEVLRNGEGTPLGRVALLPPTSIASFGWPRNNFSTVTAGPARTRTGVHGLAGLLVGRPARAARDGAIPDIEASRFCEWASEAARAAVNRADGIDHRGLAVFAEGLDELGAQTDYIERWQTGVGWLNQAGLINWLRELDSFHLVHPIYVEVRVGSDSTFVALNADVVCFEPGRRIALDTDDDWPVPGHRDFDRYGMIGAFAHAISEAWNMPIDVTERAYLVRESNEVVIGTHESREVVAPVATITRVQLESMETESP